MPRRIIAVPAPIVTLPTCEDCGKVIPESDIVEYSAECNRGPDYREIPRCCESCAVQPRNWSR